ncbi:MAG: hypothetical protein ACOZBH_00940 [Patescibacteria group bacterium]
MNRGEKNIPIHIHRQAGQAAGRTDFSEYIEKEETLKNSSVADPLAATSQIQPDEPVRNLNAIQGLIDHQEDFSAGPVAKADKRNALLWLFVSIFTLATALIWLGVWRANFSNVSDQLKQQDDQGGFSNIAEQFQDSFRFLRDNVDNLNILKQEIENEQKKNEAVQELKNKIESQPEPGGLPKSIP